MWTKIDGRRYSPEEFGAWLAARAAPSWAQFVVLHNTGNPSLDPCKDHGSWYGAKTTPIQRVTGSLVNYYRDVLKWSAGPHCFVDREGIWIFTPPTQFGVHSPSWNRMAWGVEMAGDYDVEAFDPKVRDNAVACAAALLNWRGLDATDKTIRLHKEDKKTTHACPGKNVDKADMVKRIAAALDKLHVGGEHDPTKDEHAAVAALGPKTAAPPKS